MAILRCGKLPSFVTWEIPNLDELFEEDHLLLRGFEKAGIEAEPVVWSDLHVDWDRFDIALLRSTWDYLDDRQQFLQVLSQIEDSSCTLFNPLAAVRWNIDKHYLFDLENWGVPIIPTYLASEVEHDPSLLQHESETVVIKPTIGLGGSHSYRVPVGEITEALRSLRASHLNAQYLIQPFIGDILTEGEWSFIYFNRRLSHVLLKKPAANDYRVQGIYGGTIQPARSSTSDLLQAEMVLSRIPFDMLYARLDFVRVNGQLAIIEVELIEPILSFNLVPEGIERLVQATLLRLKKRE